jgi:outer membrane protein assembly factor BamE (lipoprotein component of BamABCDE complex)
MPNEKDSYNVENQNARRDIVNVVTYQGETKEKVTLPSIQCILRKGKTFKGDFSKKEPEWVDFEQGFIVERREVDEIIKKLENEKIQLILGTPASGKSIILKNVGFKLANENKDVCAVELKKYPRDEVKLLFNNILKLNNEKLIFIVDDAHLSIENCERFVREFKNGGCGKLIIGSRPTEEILGGHPKNTSEFEYLSKMEVHAEDVAEEMTKSFLKVDYNFSDERINTIVKNIEKYKKDLWFLSWALKAYDPKKDSIEEEEIYAKVRDSIRSIDTGKGITAINAEDVFLPLSIFYRFEIPTERAFLEEQMGIEGTIINRLIEMSEIVETEEIGRNKMLSFNHSSIAELYYGAYQRYPSLGKRISNKILNQKNRKYLENCLFYKYITTYPRNAVEVVVHLREPMKESQGAKILEKLTKCNKIQKSIEEGIKREIDILEIGKCVLFILQAREEAGSKLINSIDIGDLSSKIDNEEDVLKIGYGLDYMHNKELRKNLVNNIDIDALSLKIEKEEDICAIGDCIEFISFSNEKAGLKLVEKIDIDNLLSRIDNESSIKKIGIFVTCILHANEEVGMKLIDKFSKRFEKEDDIEKIEWIVLSISRKSGKAAAQLVDSFSKKIEKQDIGRIEQFVWNLCTHEDVIRKLVVNFDIDVLSSKIQNDEGIYAIGRFIWEISHASEEVGLKLVESIDIDVLSSKIDKEENLNSVEWIITSISYTSEEVGLELVESVSSKIEKEKDIVKISPCIDGTLHENKNVACKLVENIGIDILSSKINNEENLNSVKRIISSISYASKDVGSELVKNIDTNILSSKINNEPDLGNILRCILEISYASSEVGSELVKSIDIDILLSKIKNGRDILLIEHLMPNMLYVNEEFRSKLVKSCNKTSLKKYA